MYAVEVRDRIMIAHSFKGELFGPAQAVHGATFVVDVAFFRETLTGDVVVVDMAARTTPSGDAAAAELPEPRRAAAICRAEHHDGVSPRTSSTPWRTPPAGALGPGSEGVSRFA